MLLCRNTHEKRSDMKKKYLILLLFTLSVQFVIGQTITVTIDDYEEEPGLVSIPVEVANFDNVGAITFFIEFDETVITYDSYTAGGIDGIVTNTIPSTNGYILGISWLDENGVTFDGTLFTLNFNYLGGTSQLDFLASSCEITDVDVIPIPTVYFDGSISPSATAVPITLVDQIDIDPTLPGFPGYIDIPIEVEFADVPDGVGSFNFEIAYNENLLAYQSLQYNHISIDGVTINTLTSPARIAIIWNASTTPSSFDGTLLIMRFGYTGGNTELNFLPAASEIADFNAVVLNPIYDDGIVTQLSSTLPNIVIDSIGAAAGDVIEIPVTIRNPGTVVNYGALDFSIGFNSSVLEFVSLTDIHPSISIGIYYNAITDELNIAWSGGPVVFTETEPLLFNLQFNYSGTDQDVFFKEENCSMADYDTNPINAFYIDGKVTEIPGGNTTVCMDTVVSPISSEILMPISVTEFDDVGAITLELTFDPLLLSYIAIETEHPLLLSEGSSFANSIGGIFSYSWTVNPAAIVGIDIPDDDVLFYIKFFYNTGPATLEFNTPVCEIANFATLPLNVFYCDGLVRSGIEADITLFLEGLYDPSTHEMRKTQDYDGFTFVDKFPGTIADEITIELHDATDYSTIVHTILNVELNQDGTASFEVPEIYTGSYWVTVKNRNHLETVSQNIINFASGSVVYNFTTDASQAFGNNQVMLEPGIYGVYVGDVDQNGIVNVTDRSQVDVGIYNLVVGYFANDVDGNGIVNVTDRTKVDVNIYNLIEKQIPPN
jgi:hypothetical protein